MSRSSKMHWGWLTLAAFFAAVLFAAAPASQAQGGGQEKVTICHIPPGNPDNAHNITVGAPAVPAHLAHGDELGDCLQGPPPDA